MKLYYGLIGLISLFTLKQSYNYLLNNKNLYRRIIFCNLTEEKYYIFCKNIYNYCKNYNVNKIYQFIIDNHIIDLPIESFIYSFNKINYKFIPIIDKNKLIGYDIEYNIDNTNINDLIIYVINNK